MDKETAKALIDAMNNLARQISYLNQSGIQHRGFPSPREYEGGRGGGRGADGPGGNVTISGGAGSSCSGVHDFEKE